MTTIWVTDVPAQTTAFLPGGLTWEALDPSAEGAGTVSGIWRDFASERPAWIAVEPGAGDGFRLLVGDADTSQFDRMMERVRQLPSPPDGLVCIALTGRGFRGQRNRPWRALPGNLHLTAHYALELPAREVQAALTMLPAVAAVEAAAGLLGEAGPPSIKWVNDVVCHGRKIAGVLTATQVTGDIVDRVVFGIGMNVACAPDVPPTPFVPATGCLAGFVPALVDALPEVYRRLVDNLDALVSGLKDGKGSDVFARYRAYAGFIGSRVRLWPEGTDDWKSTPLLAEGTVVTLQPDLSLILDGCKRPITSGRMAVIDPP